jgi:nucleoid DNA-binding protein
LIPEELLEGKIVDLGDFGSFRLSIKAEGSDTATL